MPGCFNSYPGPYQRFDLHPACQTRPAYGSCHELPRQKARHELAPLTASFSPDGWLHSTGEWKRATHETAGRLVAAAQGRAHWLSLKVCNRSHQQATAHTLAAFCFQTERLCASRCRLACITSSGKRPLSEALTKCHLQMLDQTDFRVRQRCPVLLCRCQGQQVKLSCSISSVQANR